VYHRGEAHRPIIDRRMPALVYFDTDFFHHFATTFQRRALAADLRDRILLSPMTMKEVFSHLAVEWGPLVHSQIRELPNWLNKRTGLLPWMSDAIGNIAFGVPIPDDGFTQGMQESVNELLNYQLEDVLAAATALRNDLDKTKREHIDYFKEALEHFSKTPLTENTFTNVWVNGIKRRLHLEENTTPPVKVVEALSAYHEFDFNKLKVALANKEQYNIEKHRNDLFDAEQLVYLKDPSLHFLTGDHGYLRKVVVSPFRSRIHEVPVADLTDAEKLESLLRQITC
jgi:hypothetical protein